MINNMPILEECLAAWGRSMKDPCVPITVNRRDSWMNRKGSSRRDEFMIKLTDLRRKGDISFGKLKELCGWHGYHPRCLSSLSTEQIIIACNVLEGYLKEEN